MDHLETLKEWLEYYKGRYEKAVSLNITEGSRYYPAFKEIEKRYVALYLTVSFYEDIPRFLAGEKAEIMIKSYVIAISKELFMGVIIRNEEGKKEYIHTRVTIKKSDIEMVEKYEASRVAIKRFEEIDFNRTDVEQLASEIREDIFCVVSWHLIAREMIFAVNTR